MDSEVNQVLSNVAEGSDEEEGVETDIPGGVPSTSQSDGSLCVRAKRVMLLGSEQQLKKQEHSHHHHHHHHHQHNHNYYGQQQQQRQHCSARLSSGESSSSSTKHRLHSNSCHLI